MSERLAHKVALMTGAAELGRCADYHSLDVTDPAAWDTAVPTTLARFGRLDILGNNAGIGIASPLDEIPLEDDQHVIDIDLYGAVSGMRCVEPAMQKSGGGSIVDISSIDVLVGVTHMTSCSASKFAVTGMTRSAALELGPIGIRVDSIHSGVIDGGHIAGPWREPVG